MNPHTNNRLAFLDAIRGIAALAVFFQHIGEGLWPMFGQFTHNWFNLGKFGVVSFFLVSGFIIPVSLERANSATKFWIGRFFRLYPLYWLSLGAVFVLYSIGVDLVSAEFEANAAENFLFNITMLQGFLKHPDALGLYSTLTLELFFYASCTLLFLARQRNSYLLGWLALVGTALISIAVPLLFGLRVPMAAAFYILTMFFGTVVYRYYSGEVSREPLIKLSLGLICVAVVGIYVNYTLYQKAEVSDHQTFLAVFSSWTAGYALFFSAFALRNRQYYPALLWLGRISYSVYLLHPIVRASISLLFPASTPPILVLLSLLACTLALSTLTYKFVESPAIALGKRVQNSLLSKMPTLVQ